MRYEKEFKQYLQKNEVKPVKPSDRAKILFGFGEKRMLYILNSLGVEEKKINAIKMVSDGNSYLEVSKIYNCSAETIRSWINKTYKEVCKYGTDD